MTHREKLLELETAIRREETESSKERVANQKARILTRFTAGTQEMEVMSFPRELIEAIIPLVAAGMRRRIAGRRNSDLAGKGEGNPRGMEGSIGAKKTAGIGGK